MDHDLRTIGNCVGIAGVEESLDRQTGVLGHLTRSKMVRPT